mmetsp:Transcript_18900/g.34101  ORF Transcript_18900/g.34101 Transcript_18900/m.34101 type:complete len:96 (-) Transcript_18900:59-346(-)
METKELAEFAVQQTIERMSQCVIGILERPDDTRKALERHLPWLAQYINFDKRINTGVVSKGNLSNETVAQIETVSQYERHVYKVANQLLDVQMSL